MTDWKSHYKTGLNLFGKELKANLYSLTGLIFMLLFLLISGLLLWVLPGEYNVVDNGYATLKTFFSFAPVLFLVLIPAMAMRSFAEEKRTDTFSLLMTRPVTINGILSSKILSVFLIVFIVLILGIPYVFTLYYYGSPVGNVDLGAIAASYIGLLFLAFAFICISVFASSLTSSQVIALILGLFISLIFYYGFDLIGLSNLSFYSHFKSIQRGLIETQDLFYFLSIACLFYFLTLIVLEKCVSKAGYYSLGLLLLFASFSFSFHFSFDWTTDKRYTVSDVSRQVLKTMFASTFS